MRSDLRLAFLIAGLHSGGAETQARHLLSGLARRGVEVQLFSSRGEGAMMHEVEAAGVHISYLSLAPRKLWSIRALSRVHAVAQRRKIRLVQSFLPSMDVIAPLIRLWSSRYRVITSRRALDEYLPPRDLGRLRVTGRWAHRIVGNSQAVAESVRRHEGFRPPQVRVIPNGIPVPEPIRAEERIGARSAFGVADDAFVVAFAAHFRRGKGHAHVPALAATLRTAVPNAVLLLAGDPQRAHGRIHASMRAEMEAEGLLDRVRFLGDYRDQRTLYAASDAALNLSDSEGMSNSVLEAMAYGVPVVATAVGGNKEVIRDGVDGRLVARNEVVPATCAALRRWAENAEARMAFGGEARAQVAREFSIDRMVERYIELYKELDPPGSPPARAEAS